MAKFHTVLPALRQWQDIVYKKKCGNGKISYVHTVLPKLNRRQDICMQNKCMKWQKFILSYGSFHTKMMARYSMQNNYMKCKISYFHTVNVLSTLR